MPPRLSELLERIRPAGTPGAPSEGEQQREEYDRASETADIAAVLATFEREADGLVVAANEEATQLLGDADRQARRLRSELPERIATVQAAATRSHVEQNRAEESSASARAEAEVARLNTKGEELIPELTGKTIDSIWSMVSAAPPQKEQG